MLPCWSLASLQRRHSSGNPHPRPPHPRPISAMDASLRRSASGRFSNGAKQVLIRCRERHLLHPFDVDQFSGLQDALFVRHSAGMCFGKAMTRCQSAQDAIPNAEPGTCELSSLESRAKPESRIYMAILM